MLLELELELELHDSDDPDEELEVALSKLARCFTTKFVLLSCLILISSLIVIPLR